MKISKAVSSISCIISPIRGYPCFIRYRVFIIHLSCRNVTMFVAYWQNFSAYILFFSRLLPAEIINCARIGYKNR
uniref:Uncharacterized protein n=1 Tax=Siphoviridae sp. ctY1p61 TaxID=2826373 RepID=A0A8S5NMK1_9CAUD|nr:MAG TPA: hypothetical protein [Siphoviridae sp. ctY1p61]